MKTITWDIKETFHFPQLYGSPSNVPDIRVVPQCTNTVTPDSVRLHGIYHIAANVEFKPFEGNFPMPYNGVVIDFIEMRDDQGYFEYAVPLTVDIPREGVLEGFTPTLEVQDIKTAYRMPGSVDITWKVACSYQEPGEESSNVKVESSSSSSSSSSDQEGPAVTYVEVEAQTDDLKVTVEKRTEERVEESSSSPVAEVLERKEEPYRAPIYAQERPKTAIIETVVVEEKPEKRPNRSELGFLNDLKDTYSVFTFRSDVIVMERKPNPQK